MAKTSTRRSLRNVGTVAAGALTLGSLLATGLPAANAHAARAQASATTLTFWNPFSGPDGSAMKQIVTRFNASQKNIQINMTIVPNANYGGSLTTAISAHKAPNMFVVDDVAMATYAAAGILTPVQQAADTVGLKQEQFYSSLWQGGNYKSTQYAIPMDALPLTLYYNKAVFKANGLDPNTPPANESAFLKDAEKMTHGSTYGFVVPPDWPEPFVWPTLLAQFGGQEMDIANQKVLYNSKAGIAALSLLHDWIYKYKISPQKTAVDYDIKAISSGKAGMIVDGPWQYTQLHSTLGSNLGVAAVPQWGPKPGVFLGQHYFALYKSTGQDSAQTKAALTFIKYFEDNSILWAQAGDLPAYKPTLDSSAFKKLSYEVAIAKSLPYGYLNPKFPNYGSVSTTLYPQIIDALLGKKSPQAALDYATQQATKAVQASSSGD
jgi:multiple sugar transport system substrate-binding protein